MEFGKANCNKWKIFPFIWGNMTERFSLIALLCIKENVMNPTFDRLYKEISETQQRRNKLDVLKITFVSALLGFGAIKINDITAFYQILYVAPLVAVFLDFLVMGEHFSIRRVGAFLRLHPSSDKTEQDYEYFVSQNRDRFFVMGSRGFTILSFVAAIALLWKTRGTVLYYEWLWFVAVFIFFIIAMYCGKNQLFRLDSLTELPKK